MIERIEFKNFKALRDTSIELKPFTLVVGPNGSGKSSIGQALAALSDPNVVKRPQFVSVGAPKDAAIELRVIWNGQPPRRLRTIARFDDRSPTSNTRPVEDSPKDPSAWADWRRLGASVASLAFDSRRIALPMPLSRTPVLLADGSNLVVVLDQLRDQRDEEFKRWNADLAHWLPEFDRIVFDTTEDGLRTFGLQTSLGKHVVSASELSDGTLLALAYMTLPYVAAPPRLIFVEEPERGIHPRLLQQVRDALFRLSHPPSGKPAIQVIATTHSPYFLDLFKEHIDDVVVANKKGNQATFEPLKSQPHIGEILGDAPLGEAWYSGVLGGVPASP